MTAHRIDVHHHILPPDYVAVVGDDRIGPLILAGKTPDWTPQMSIEAMDRNGIATAITSISAPGLWFGDIQATITLTRHCNEYAAQVCQQHPGRFGMFASLPLPDVDASLKEIAYALDVLKADGIGLLTSYGDKYPGDPAFSSIFEELNRRKAVVYFHPTAAQCCTCLPLIPAATLEFPFDTTRAIVSLLFSGTLANCPDIKFIFSHAGGTAPFLGERIGRLANRPGFKEKVPNGVLPELGRLYYDTALSANEIAFASLLKVTSEKNVLFGSDYPFAPEAAMSSTVAGLQKLNLSADALQGIERNNALRIMPSLAS
ncbi:amidohydrolase family protein [Ferrovibrio sp.]|uniref:amidohydrolase family protein n=1 Tax=Ferrovibrio sp. TaxID=1917215 RepID=UPI0035AE12CD